MKNAYVAGEVIRSATQKPIRMVYNKLQQLLSQRGFEVQLPEIESQLDNLDPRDFYGEVQSRIREADIVFTVLGRKSYSPPVEATIAAYEDKLQIILVPPGKNVGRMLSGLPSLVAIGDYRQIEDLINRFTEGEGPEGGPGSGAKNPPPRPRSAPSESRSQKASSYPAQAMSEPVAGTMRGRF